MVRSGLCVGVLVISCGGASTPPPAAPEEPAAVATAHEAEPPASSEEKKPSSDESKSGESGKVTSDQELGAVLQLVIEDAELDKYLRLTEPGRFPLKLYGHDLPSGLALTKAGQPVKLVGSPPAKKDAVLVLTKIEIDGPQATVGYRYDIEGIVGTARLKKASYGWELSSSRIVEHYKKE